MSDLIFCVLALISVVFSVLLVSRKNPVYSAANLVVTLLSLALLFIQLEAPFLAGMHVMVYTGAIMVLFLFVIMLLNLRTEELGAEEPVLKRVLIGVVCLSLFAMSTWIIMKEPINAENIPADWGSVEMVGLQLFKNFLLPFELISILIIVAMIGGVVLAKRKL